jgi:ABC-2 type transport system permease protein
MALSLDSVQIGILIDPVTKKSFVTSVISNLREFISEIKNKIMFRAFADRLAELVPDKDKVPRNAYSQTQIVTYRESYASQAQTIIPNAVQHNVPAWAIFAMFFIAIPLCGSIMKEKSEGSAFRLHTMPSPYLLLTLGKLIVYVIVCLIQLLLMLCLGIFLLPILGLPALALGHSWFALFMLSFCTALAATGYGIMVGTLASTEQQGAILGSFSILLFSALGGIWVPSYVMPDVMRSISVFSPMNWSLDGYYKLFLRGAGLSALRADCFKLLAFFVLTLGLATWVYRAGRKI